MVNFAAVAAAEAASFFEDFGEPAVIHGRNTRAFINDIQHDAASRPGVVATVAVCLVESAPVLAGGGKPPANGDEIRVGSRVMTVTRHDDESLGVWRVVCESAPRSTLRR